MKKKWGIFAAILLTFSMILSACSSTSGGSSDKDKSGKLEIFSWWTAGGEADGLKALIKVFEKKQPDLKVNNAAVAGGAGTNAKAVLATRMQGGDPPSTFQVHGGAELMAWVNSDKMQPLNDLYKKNGWDDKFPKELINMVSKDSKIYAIPVDIHRGNVLFYNKKIFEDNHLEAPKTFDDFFKVADKLKAKGITPLALGDKEIWPATMLFENILLGKLGPDKYKALWTGGEPFDSPEVKESAEIFKKMLGYINDDHSSRAWQDASQLVADGKAAMNVMGDWAAGYYTSLNLKPNKDYGWIETPESDGDFMVITDTFGLPKGVKNEGDVKKFLTVLGSVEGQDAFNPLKGSIPARTDADPSKYDDYSKDAMKDFKSDALTPSLAHGSAAPESYLTKVNQAVNIFVTQKNVDQFIQSLKDASSELKK
ncbi:carbohydrate ABC transporter substrate-binding protein (CUT1 family) [Scopulibacillus darangshiensis]|uniref:Probable sugar-binding periplasmic protein n=1 Tax=Scopulibacillus darangshiensis TaxID=442528 RepID=A0A4V2SNN0_9BACL|nr:ABC transporter substrate-binding protein [Scopulibacillus darangshiensis]TCP31756.1 carbohydrate ABC transporter substrate-binding protein (CUT1 family) [Scopulibacillus darangshiensis]